MVEFNFTSQVATTIAQSQRLLALGLRKETADMVHYKSASMKEWGVLATQFTKECEGCKCYFPAWSLHRLIEIFDTNPFVFYTNCGYDNVIDRIEIYIKEGLIDARYMNEGYLEEE